MFTAQINKMTKTKEYLKTRRSIDANFLGYKHSRDLPTDHKYGQSSELDPTHCMAQVVKNAYALDKQ